MPQRDGRHSRWNGHREERRRLILDAAIAVVEEAPQGAELRLQDVAARAGLVRTVVQRHFGGQVGLLRAVQADVLEQAFALIGEPVELSSSLHDIAVQIVGTTIEWVDGHPGLHALIEREVGDGEPSELSRAIGSYALFLSGLVEQVAEIGGVRLTSLQNEEIRLLSVGIIGQVRVAVTGWREGEYREVGAAHLGELLATWITAQIVLQARRLGLRLDPELPLAEAAMDLMDTSLADVTGQ
ncbi:MAG: TetR/AcrR family transcriptional regulator [Nocardioides sp.]